MPFDDPKTKAHGSCGSQAGIPILPDFKTRHESAGACCPDHENTVDRLETEPKTFFRKPVGPMIIAGLFTSGLLAAGAGFVPGLDPARFRQETIAHLAFIGKAVWSILPFFIISVGISAWVTSSGFSDRIQAIFHRRERTAIWGAALVGAVVPLCSCGVIPVIAALLASGVPLGPVMAFWLSSPLMSPEMFVLTAGMLGGKYAVARLISAVAIGAGAGFFIYFLSSRGLLDDQLHGMSTPESVCCGKDAPASHEPDEPKNGLGGKFWPQAWQTTLFLGKWLLIAFLLESLIVHYIDPAWIGHILGRDRFFAVPLATVIGIPLYTSGVAAIPIVEGLLNSGMGHGAALAFLVAGPVTTIPAMTAVFAIVKRKTFAIYLGSGIAGALISGYIFQTIF